jgi:hypothetical protein
MTSSYPEKGTSVTTSIASCADRTTVPATLSLLPCFGYNGDVRRHYPRPPTFRTLSPDELAKLMTPTGELRFYTFGKIAYNDEFGAPHTTTFCHVYFGPERLDRGNNQFAYESWQAKFCDRHNEAD